MYPVSVKAGQRHIRSFTDAWTIPPAKILIMEFVAGSNIRPDFERAGVMTIAREAQIAIDIQEQGDREIQRAEQARLRGVDKFMPVNAGRVPRQVVGAENHIPDTHSGESEASENSCYPSADDDDNPVAPVQTIPSAETKKQRKKRVGKRPQMPERAKKRHDGHGIYYGESAAVVPEGPGSPSEGNGPPRAFSTSPQVIPPESRYRCHRFVPF
jgi:hypothetical protein